MRRAGLSTRGRTLKELPSGFESLFLLQIVSDARRHCELFRKEIVVILLLVFFIFEFLFKISTLLNSSLGPTEFPFLAPFSDQICSIWVFF